MEHQPKPRSNPMGMNKRPVEVSNAIFADNRPALSAMGKAGAIEKHRRLIRKGEEADAIRMKLEDEIRARAESGNEHIVPLDPEASDAEDHA